MTLYIHIPFCISKCAYCDFFSKPFSSVKDSYVDALCKELDFRFKHKEGPRTVYIGGGTPSLLSENQLKKIISHIPLCNVKEFTIEVNPDDVNEKLLTMYAENGITRISCGIQSLNDKSLEVCKRRAGRVEVLSALKCFKENWKGDLSFDLISGLPYEIEETFIEGLKIISESGANHISLYALTIEEETPLGKMIDKGIISYDYEKADSMWLLGRDFLEKNGFSQYEVSNFCRNEKVSFHNMAYWEHESYIGCGSGGTGTIYREDGSAFRWTNSSDLKSYTDFWNSLSLEGNLDDAMNKIPQETEELDKETEIFEFFMMGLRTIKGVSRKRFETLFNKLLPENFVLQMKKWKEQGLSEIHSTDDDEIYTLGKKGICFLNRFLTELEL